MLSQVFFNISANAFVTQQSAPLEIMNCHIIADNIYF